jgi:hypothetical protein
MLQKTLFLALLTFLPLAAFSKDKEQGPDHLMVGPGIFDVDKTYPKFLAHLEYRWDVNCHNVRPLVGFFITTNQGVYACGGVAYDIFIGPHFVITPSFAAGVFAHGWGKNLGFPINFRSAMEMAYVFKDKGRVGAQFNHISNAGMLHRNPGANSLIFYFAVPFSNVKQAKK